MDEYNSEQLKTEPLPKEEIPTNSKKEKVEEFGTMKKAKTTAKVTSIVLTVVGISLIVGSVISIGLSTRTSTVVDRFDLVANETSIDYDISISKSNDERLVVKIHNQFMSRTTGIVIGENIGSFTQLEPGIQYTIAILENNKTVTSQKITTTFSSSQGE